MKVLTVHVTEPDIEKAQRAKSQHCAVVRAIARQVPAATRIEADLQTIRFTADGARMVYLTPLIAQHYIVAFDAGDDIGPFSFRLQRPIEARRRELTEAGKAVARAKRRGEPRPSVKGPVTALAPGSPSSSRQAAPPLSSRSQSKVRSYGHRVLRENA